MSGDPLLILADRVGLDRSGGLVRVYEVGHTVFQDFCFLHLCRIVVCTAAVPFQFRLGTLLGIDKIGRAVFFQFRCLPLLRVVEPLYPVSFLLGRADLVAVRIVGIAVPLQLGPAGLFMVVVSLGAMQFQTGRLSLGYGLRVVGGTLLGAMGVIAAVKAVGKLGLPSAQYAHSVTRFLEIPVVVFFPR